MLKKLFYAGGGLTLLALLLFGRQAYTHCATVCGIVQENVHQNMPIKYDLKRARHLIDNIQPQILNHKQEVAREEIELRRLRKGLQSREQALAKDWSDITRFRDDLEQGRSHYEYSGETYAADRVEKELTTRFEKYETKQSTLEHERQILAAREKALQAAQEKLRAMIAEREQLQVQIENLEAQLRMVEVAKTTNKLHIDNDQLSDTRKLLDDIAARIEVDAEMANADQVVPDRIELDAPAKDANILDRISDFENRQGQAGEAYVTHDEEE